MEDSKDFYFSSNFEIITKIKEKKKKECNKKLKAITMIAHPAQPISMGFLFIIIYESPTKRTCNLYGDLTIYIPF